jgi:hypothetical protein
MPEADGKPRRINNDDVVDGLDRFVFLQFEEAVYVGGRLRENLDNQARPVGCRRVLIERWTEDAHLRPAKASCRRADTDVGDKHVTGNPAVPQLPLEPAIATGWLSTNS